MSTLQIYCIYDDNNELFSLMNKLTEAGADLSIYDFNQNNMEFEANPKISRLISVYGKSILPIVVLDGEIVSVEKFPASMSLIKMTGLSAKKLQRAEIDLNQCGGSCGCSRASSENSKCSSCTGCNNNYECNSCDKHCTTDSSCTCGRQK